MKRVLFMLITLTSITLAHAQGDDRRGGTNSAAIQLGNNRGGFTFGASFEHLLDGSMGVGGHLRISQKDDETTAAGTVINQEGLMIIGGDLSYHFYKKNWDLSFTPSINMINIDGADDESTIGPGLAIGLLQNITPQFALGFEHTQYWAWFNDDYGGTKFEELTVKGRFTF